MRTTTALALATATLALPLAVGRPSASAPQAGQSAELWQQVEVIRTAYGVPHIRADNLRAAGYALAGCSAKTTATGRR